MSREAKTTRAAIFGNLRKREKTSSNRILHEAVVVEFFSNPHVDLSKEALEQDGKSQFESYTVGSHSSISRLSRDRISRMPRCSLAAIVTTERAGHSTPIPQVFYPLFPHLTTPIKPGEKVWVIYDQPGGSGFWVSRISCDLYVDDMNYSHHNRGFLYKQSYTPETGAAAAHGDTEDPPEVEGIPDELIYGWPGGGEGNPFKDTFRDDAAFNRIVRTSPSYVEQFNGEPVPRYSPILGETVLQGSNNTLITLGQDRNLLAPEEDPATDKVKGIGAIDMVVGRGQTPETAAIAVQEATPRGTVIKPDGSTFELPAYEEINKYPGHLELPAQGNPEEGNPDFIHDLSRLYISMKSNGDADFDLSFVNEFAPPIEEAPFIVMKSDEIRLVGRGSVRAKSEAGAEMGLMSNDEAYITGGRVFLGAPEETHGAPGHYHVIRGEMLLEAVNNLCEGLSFCFGAPEEFPLGIPCGNIGAPLTTAFDIQLTLDAFKEEVEASLSAVVHTE